jgi:hypothetical protein
MTALERINRENRERVLKIVESKTEQVAYREKLDLRNPADRVTAYTKVFNEDHDLYNLYRRVFSVPVRAVSLVD